MRSALTGVWPRYAGRLGALALGLGLLGAPTTSLAQSKLPAPPAPPPPATAAPPLPPPASPDAELPPPPPPPLQGTPPPMQPGQQPYPYPYPYPYGQPGYPYPPPGYAYPPPEAEERRAIIPYKGGVIPPGYQLEERMRKGLVIAGSVVFGVFYLFTVAGAASGLDSNRAPYGALFVPVLGPFIVAGAGEFRGLDTLIVPLLIFDGIAQAGGAAMLLAGILAKQKVLVREDTAMRPELLVGPGSVGMKMTF